MQLGSKLDNSKHCEFSPGQTRFRFVPASATVLAILTHLSIAWGNLWECSGPTTTFDRCLVRPKVTSSTDFSGMFDDQEFLGLVDRRKI